MELSITVQSTQASYFIPKTHLGQRTSPCAGGTSKQWSSAPFTVRSETLQPLQLWRDLGTDYSNLAQPCRVRRAGLLETCPPQASTTFCDLRDRLRASCFSQVVIAMNIKMRTTTGQQSKQESGFRAACEGVPTVAIKLIRPRICDRISGQRNTSGGISLFRPRRKVGQE